MQQLRRRTCPGFDGRRNRPNQPSNLPPPSANITWSNEEGVCHEKSPAEGQQEDSDLGMVSSPSKAGVKVSRSPSPTNSPMNHLPAGIGTLGGSSLESVISEEDKYHGAAKNQHFSLPLSSSENGILEGQTDFYRTVSQDVGMKEYHQAEEYYVVDQLNHHLVASSDRGFAPATKKSRKPKLTESVWSDNENDSSTQKKYLKDNLQDRQDHRLAVAEVSRNLKAKASDHAASVCASPLRRKGRAGLGASLPGQAIRSTSASHHVFGLEKPYDHYYGTGKCDLLTYDCEDGFVIDDQDDRECSKDKKDALAPSKSPGTPSNVPTATAPPSQCPVVNQSLVQACMEGKLVTSTSTFERTLASSILSFCLPTNPHDPVLAKKITAHLKKGPMLAKEFEMYCTAISPGYATSGRSSASEDLKQDWKMFSTNFIRGVILAHDKCEQLSATEKEAINRCVTSWFEDI